MKEAIVLIKKLWNEEWVNFKGQHYWVRDSNPYTKPEKSIPIYIAASGRQSAQLAGEEGDGIVINEDDPGKIKDELIPAFENGARMSGRDPAALERTLFIAASYDQDLQKATEAIRFWRGAMIKAFFDVEIHDPRKIEANGQVIGDDSIRQHLLVISSGQEGITRLEKFVKLGFTEIMLINSSPDRRKLIDLVAEEIAP
jgi:coenzyme F420-dependent glucose-6-phosphate dehydrogenase